MSISDHDMIGCVYKVNNMNFNGHTIHSRDYRNYNPEQLQKDTCESNLRLKISNQRMMHHYFLNPC